MKYICTLSLLFLLVCPFASSASEPPGSGLAAQQQPVFTPPTMKAFDHSGKAVLHSTRADGSHVADHQGTLGHVLLARMGSDGSIETYCTTKESQASAWLAGEPAEPSAASHTRTAVED